MIRTVMFYNMSIIELLSPQVKNEYVDKYSRFLSCLDISGILWYSLRNAKAKIIL